MAIEPSPTLDHLLTVWQQLELRIELSLTSVLRTHGARIRRVRGSTISHKGPLLPAGIVQSRSSVWEGVRWRQVQLTHAF